MIHRYTVLLTFIILLYRVHQVNPLCCWLSDSNGKLHFKSSVATVAKSRTWSSTKKMNISNKNCE